MARVGEAQFAGGRVEHAEEEGDEAVARALGASRFVEPHHERAEVARDLRPAPGRARASAIIISDAGMPLPETSPSASATLPSG